MHQRMAAALDEALDEIAEIQRRAREDGDRERPRWPMIVLRTPKGWTGPGEGTPASHQVPLSHLREDPEALAAARGVDALLPAGGAVRRRRRRRATTCWRRRPRASGGWAPSRRPTAGCCGRTCGCPTSATTRSTVAEPARTTSEATRVLGAFLRDVIARNPATFRLFGPDETASNRSRRCSRSPTAPGRRVTDADDHLAPTAASSRCSASTCARAGSRATCSPAATGSSTATRRSSTSSTRCSTSTPSG